MCSRLQRQTILQSKFSAKFSFEFIKNLLLNKIFDRFYSNRPGKFGEHSGLGLSISKQIIEAHNGSITAENKINKNGKIAGARFTIMLKKIQ